MQDYHFDELREALGAQQGEGFEEKLSHMLNNKVGDDLDDEERDRREREYYRSMLEPKYVVVKEGGRYRFRARYTDYHRSMLSYDEIRMGKCDGGGFWGVDGETKRVTLYDSSSDFGWPKNIEAAIRQDGANLLEMLGRECDKTGVEHDLSDYTITYVDAIGQRHIVEPPYNQQPDIMETSQVLHNYADHGIRASVSINKHKTPRQEPKGLAKKKKAKRRQQKLSRRKR